jgi:geranylgeranyl pyrophosphate synthase
MPPDIVKVKELIRDSGAIYYSILQAELYKQKALKALSRAAAIGAKVKKLEVFLA